MDRSRTSSEISFLGYLEKANALVLGNLISSSSLSSQLIVLVFTKQRSGERYLANIFLENSSSASKHVPKNFRKFTKNTRGEVLCW